MLVISFPPFFLFMFFSASRNLGGKNEVVGGKKVAKNRKVFFPLGATVDKAKSPFFSFFAAEVGIESFIQLVRERRVGSEMKKVVGGGRLA